MRELARQPVDQRDDRIAVGHRQRAAGAEIVLHIDDHQRLAVIT